MHNAVWWIIVGFIAGALAKSLAPGTHKEPKGCLTTIFLGVAGSLITGFVMDLLGMKGEGGLIPTICGATLGALALIYALRKWWK
jgi:uncharacterized membrane protein YeaQ/YmgE (transglycosylase-associated protein family)